MTVVAEVDPIQAFIDNLRERYGVVDSIKIVRDNFPEGLVELVTWAATVLRYTPQHQAAIKTLEAIQEYRNALPELLARSQSQPQPFYPSR